MLAVRRSQTAREEEYRSSMMEARLAKIEDMIRKLIEKTGILRRENTGLWRTNEKLAGGDQPSATSTSSHNVTRRVLRRMKKDDGCI